MKFDEFWGEGGGCLSGDTLIQTPLGLIPIQNIKTGDEVFCFSPENKISIKKVLSTNIHHDQQVFRYTYWGGYVIATPNHAFYTERNSFKEIGKWNIDEFFIDKYLEYRPLLKVEEELERTTVYNFVVDDYHTYLVGEHGIFSSNGGGGKSKNPDVDPDTALSSARAVVVEALSEGPIEGLLEGDRSIYLDRTPVGNSDGSKNFTGFKWDSRNGTGSQRLLDATVKEGLTSETSVNTEVKYNIPISRTFTVSDISFVRVRLAFQVQQYEEDGDVVASRMAFRIQLTDIGGVATVHSDDRTVKFSSATEFEYNIPIAYTTFSRPITIRVEKLVQEPTPNSNLQNTIQFVSYTTVVNDTKINYAHTAVVSAEFDAEQFSSEPQRGYKIGGRTVAIPSNAVVNDTDRGLDFSGIWDGTLYEPPIATSDPVWQLYDILTNSRYGLGKQIDSCQVSSYDLYDISRYNNEFVTNGFGGTERRFRCNTVLQQGEAAHKVLEGFLSACNSHYYWDGTCLKFWQDKPSDVIQQFTNADVENGMFSYSSTDIQTRYSVAYVTWNDPDDYYRQTVESIEVQDTLKKFGYRETDFAAYGCTSRGQAYRQGRYQVYSNFLETETVSFKCRLIGLFVRPGDIINVIDWKRSKKRYGGLITSATSTTIELDQEIILPNASGYSITCTMPDLTIETKTISNGAGSTDTIQVSTPFTTIPLQESNWFIDVINTKKYRVQVIKVDAEDSGLIEILATEYREDKFNIIENGWELESTEKEEEIPVIPPPPINLGVGFVEQSANVFKLIGRWSKPETGGSFITSYQVQWKRGATGSWSPILSVSTSELIIENLSSGTYYIRVASVLLNGGISQYVESSPAIAGATQNLYLSFNRRLGIIAA
jgi:predicted phage tail protein